MRLVVVFRFDFGGVDEVLRLLGIDLGLPDLRFQSDDVSRLGRCLRLGQGLVDLLPMFQVGDRPITVPARCNGTTNQLTVSRVVFILIVKMERDLLASFKNTH